MRRFTLLLTGSLLASSAPAEVPATRADPVKEILHDVEIADPYRWLEGSDAPEIAGDDPELDARVAAWTAQQNVHSRSVLDHLAGRQKLDARLAELLAMGRIDSPTLRGRLYFNLERHGDEPQPILVVRRGHDGKPRALLDPAALDPEGLTSISWFVPSHDGTLVAVGLHRGGDENFTLQVLKVEDTQWLADEIHNRVESVYWLPDASGFFYRHLEDPENLFSGKVRFHKLGSHRRHDPVLFANDPSGTHYGAWPYVDPSGRWLVVTFYIGTTQTDVWFYDVRHWLATGERQRVDLMIGEPARSYAFFQGDTLLLQTNYEAANGRVIAIDLRRPEREHWRDLIPERPDAVIREVHVASGLLAVQYLSKAHTMIEVFDHAGRSQGTLELPGIGTAGLSTHWASNEAFVNFESYNAPDTLYRLDLESRKMELWAQPDAAADPSRITVRQVHYPSADGTEVSMFIAHRLGLRPNGTTPTLLYGYGGFGTPLTPRFSPRVFPWLEAGGIYAVANLRGGGEYGETWHRAGRNENKQNVFDDFIAAAEWLIEKRYTDPDHLGVIGNSNGGLLTAAVLVQRPELFSAVVSEIPLLDMLRYQHFLMGRFWVPEYGSSDDPGQLAFLLDYSPYHNVKNGTKYPAVLLTTAENDPRVHPFHARKMAARLQAATVNDRDLEPILLWVAGAGGHGQGASTDMSRKKSVDILAFLAWQLGLELP